MRVHAPMMQGSGSSFGGGLWVLTRYRPGPGRTLRPVVTGPWPSVHTQACRDWWPPSRYRMLTALRAYVVSCLSPLGFPWTLQCVRVFNSERIRRKPFKWEWWTKTREEQPTGRERAGAQAVAWAPPGDSRLLWDFPLVSGTEQNISTLNWLVLNFLTFPPTHGQCGHMWSCRMRTWVAQQNCLEKRWWTESIDNFGQCPQTLLALGVFNRV